MRRKRKIKKFNIPDPTYNNPLVGTFINYIMRQGKKSVAQKVVYKSFDIIKEKTNELFIGGYLNAFKNHGRCTQ